MQQLKHIIFQNLLNEPRMYRISRGISGKPFLPTFYRYQIHSEIAHDHDLGTNKKPLN